jgi:hypothetical protein
MKKLEGYLENPFDNINASREDIAAFYSDHNNRMKQAVANGEPFAAQLPPTAAATANLGASQSSTVTTKSQLKSRTLTVDQVIASFVSKAQETEAIVLAKYKRKDTPEYIEFYPNGKSEYNNANKSNIIALFDQIILAAHNHPDVSTDDLEGDFGTLKNEYVDARNIQQQQKENKDGAAGTWEANLTLMGLQAYDNLHVIARVHPNQPERIKQYFDVSIVTYDKHPAGGEATGGYVDTIPPLSQKCMDISFSPDDVLLVSVNSTMPLGGYGAPAADSPEPATLIELPAGEETEITAVQLGAPANKFFIIVNKDETTEGEVEIVLF